MKVFCVHFLFIRNSKIVEMPSRTVKSLKDTGVVITVNEKQKVYSRCELDDESKSILWL